MLLPAKLAKWCGMAVTHFERLAQKRMDEIKLSLLSIATTDPNVVRLQASHAALADAVAMHKKAERVDDDGDIG